MRRIIRMLGILTALAAAGPLKADDQAVQQVLSWVPADPALFAHLNVKTIWTVMQNPKMKLADSAAYAKQITEYSDALGVPPETIDTMTIFLPKLKGPGDEQAFCLAVTFNKPYDAKKLAAGAHKLAVDGKLPAGFKDDKLKEEQPGRYTMTDGPTVLRFDLTNPNRLVLVGKQGSELAKPSGAKLSPMMKNMFEAIKTHEQVLNVNLAGFPDELRSVNLGPQAEPFKPLIESESILILSKYGVDRTTFEARVTCETKAKALEAEKSLGVAKAIGQVALSAVVQDLAKKKDEADAKLLATLKDVQGVLKAATITSDDRTATANLSMPSNLDMNLLTARLMAGPQAAAARSRTQNNLKQLALGMHNFDSANNQMPYPVTVGKKGKRLHSWRVQLLPYLEQEQLFRQLKMDEPWDSDHNKAIFEKTPMPSVFAVEGVTKPGEKTTHMQVFRGNGAMFDLLKPTTIAGISDGTSNTVMVALGKKPVLWYQPDDLEFDPAKEVRPMLLFIEGGTTLALGDGSVRFIRETVPEATFKALVTKSGGEVINLP